MNEETLINQDWITAADLQICRMVESLMDEPIQPKASGNDRYFLSVPYNGKSPEYLSAVLDAIRGRAGERYIDIEDLPDVGQFVVYIKFAAE